MAVQKLHLGRNDEFLKITSENPELSINVIQSLPIKNYLKNSYDYAKSEQQNYNGSKSLAKLVIQNLDIEQIWQQLELQNNEILNAGTRKLNHLESLQRYVNDKKEELEENDNLSDTDQQDSEESGIDEEGNFEDFPEDEQSDGNFSEEDAEDEEDITPQSKAYKKTVVDDKFFKLHEMEDFLISQEKEMDKDQESEEQDEEEVDYFAEDNEDEDEDMQARLAKFKEFFRSDVEETKPKRNESVDGSSEDEGDNLHSNFELRQSRLKKKIEAVENNTITEKPWALKGEIRADSRPINSLLEEHLEFDRMVRPAPVVTGQTTLSLENILRQRIIDMAWDSVEKKVKVVEEPYEFKKKLVVDQEKSKESLAQIYEKEYLEQQAALDPDNTTKVKEEPELHKEIKGLMNTLFNQLDALSNYHYTPKPAVPEIKIVSNIPALNLEEVGPVAISDAPILAPEEVKTKTKGDLLGKTERTSTDKKRERRKKKSKQRYHAQLKEKKENDVKKAGKAGKKTEIEEHLKKLTKDSNIKRMVQGSDNMKSSKAFFEQIEEKQKMKSEAVKNGIKRKKNTDSFNAKKLKL
ncbi:U3 small nucleolar ribonucleoprotein protein MPP10 [Harmonia axyridis]|uniref:U3 small nucleolar ribonucleoprotein protein MPP10 n=1 Tax=Harmonia axyridis TaxID=115357 RepID=UPI001E27823B|nr:U3 small nucleolar ribonucleoprotein protein MPP10 [Harmonia axyridis]